MNLYPTVRRGILGLLELFIGYIDIDGLYLHIKLQSGVYTVHNLSSYWEPKVNIRVAAVGTV